MATAGVSTFACPLETVSVVIWATCSAFLHLVVLSEGAACSCICSMFSKCCPCVVRLILICLFCLFARAFRRRNALETFNCYIEIPQHPLSHSGWWTQTEEWDINSVLGVGVLKCGLTGHMMHKQVMNKHLVSVEEAMKQWGTEGTMLQRFCRRRPYSSTSKHRLHFSWEVPLSCTYWMAERRFSCALTSPSRVFWDNRERCVDKTHKRETEAKSVL